MTDNFKHILNVKYKISELFLNELMDVAVLISLYNYR